MVLEFSSLQYKKIVFFSYYYDNQCTCCNFSTKFSFRIRREVSTQNFVLCCEKESVFVDFFFLYSMKRVRKMNNLVGIWFDIMDLNEEIVFAGQAIGMRGRVDDEIENNDR